VLGLGLGLDCSDYKKVDYNTKSLKLCGISENAPGTKSYVEINNSNNNNVLIVTDTECRCTKDNMANDCRQNKKQKFEYCAD